MAAGAEAGVAAAVVAGAVLAAGAVAAGAAFAAVAAGATVVCGARAFPLFPSAYPRRATMFYNGRRATAAAIGPRGGPAILSLLFLIALSSNRLPHV